MAIGNYPYGSIDVEPSPTPAFDLSLGDIFIMTLKTSILSMEMKGEQVGAHYTFIFHQDGSGQHFVVWPDNFKGCVAVPITSVANTATVQQVVYDGTNYYAVAIGQTGL